MIEVNKISVRKFLDEIPAEEMDAALVAGVTKQGNYVLVTHHYMDLKTLMQLSRMIKDHIKYVKEHPET